MNYCLFPAYARLTFRLPFASIVRASFFLACRGGSFLHVPSLVPTNISRIER